MQVIPVIDLKNQQVVHAKKGQRQLYQPIASELCSSTDLLTVVQCFLELAQFKVIYIADLDAITHAGNHDPLLIKCCAHYPDTQFWIDHGGKLSIAGNHPANYIPIIGSENLHPSQLSTLKGYHRPWVLSLDHNSQGRMGPDSLFNDNQYWPNKIIAMSLNSVGSFSGPDWSLIARYQDHLGPQQQLIASGGVRDIEDLIKLQDTGIQHVLIASALHNKKIGTNELKKLNEY
jgi:phosphoribosylformimino-5-aminoimidazole carboxamide ribotide isomerase